MTLYRVMLRDLAADALIAAQTIAGPNVFTARSLPVTSEAVPALYLQIPEDRGESDGRGQPQFRRVATLAIRGFVAAGDPFRAELLLDQLAEEVELALMTDAGLQAALSQVTELATSVQVSSETDGHIGELKMILGLEYFETYPAPGTPLTEISGTLENPPGTEFAQMQVPFPAN